MPASKNTPKTNRTHPYNAAPQRRQRKQTTPLVPPPPGSALVLAALEERLRLARGPQTPQKSKSDATDRLNSTQGAFSFKRDVPDNGEQAPIIYKLPVLDFKHKVSEDGPDALPPVRRTQSVHDRWARLLPQLVSPYLSWVNNTKSKPATFTSGSIEAHCDASNCPRSHHRILCLLPCEHEHISVVVCKCRSLAQTLLSIGLFPAAPTRPNLAFSTMILELYHELFLRSADSVNSFSGALNGFYIRRGYSTVNNEGLRTLDPYRRSLGVAFLWFTNLMARVEKDMETTLGRADAELKLRQRAVEMIKPVALQDSVQASRLLRERCPACFGGSIFGRSLQEGGDIHVAVDGNFNHRHMRAVRNCPQHYEPEYILSKAQVDAVGHRLDSARKRKKPVKNQLVPDDAIDGCQASHTAGSGSNIKTDMQRFDAGGLMGLVCRHDIPLFGANIDTPGEQQKYAVSLIERLMKELPPNASVVILYDVGCVLDRTLNLYDVMDDSIIRRITFGTSAMHAYAHDWACQLGFNPRMQEGFGLTDGEGVERLWSGMRHLIGITRTCAGNRRILLVDRQMKYLGDQSRSGLGNWITRKIERKVKPQSESAVKEISQCGLGVEELQEQWVAQRRSQLSVRAFTTAEARRKIELAVTRESELEMIESSLRRAESGQKSRNISTLRQQLAVIRDEFEEDLKKFYSSINIASRFPRVARYDKKFLTKLVIACDLKVVIRKKVIGSMFEWDRIDQASGGRDAPIGTRAHQSARRSIQRRQTTLVNLIRKFNQRCNELAEIRNPKWTISLPEQLPTDLSTMRARQDELMQDPWLLDQAPPRWMTDIKVREGIKQHLRLQRCQEEERRLRNEGDSLVGWLKKETTILEITLAMSPQHELRPMLLERQEEMRQLGLRWRKCPLVSQKDLDPITSTGYLIKESATNSRVAVVSDDVGIDADDDDPFPVAAESEEDAGDYSDDEPDIQILEKGKNLDVDGSHLIDRLQQPRKRVKPAKKGTRVQRPPGLPPIPLNWSLSPSHREQSKAELFAVLGAANPVANDDNINAEQDSTPRAMWIGDESRIAFNQAIIERMRDPKELLCDMCMNPLAELIRVKLSEHPDTSASVTDCALFSTWELPLLYSWTEQQAWDNTLHLEYWRKPTWIIPIHRDGGIGHWVVCIISFRHEEIYLFDSMAAQNPWLQDLDKVSVLISTLQRLAVERNMPVLHAKPIAWRARPALLHSRQIGNIDCGLWVLCVITAALCGYTGTSLEHDQIAPFRKLLLRYILSLPLDDEV